MIAAKPQNAALLAALAAALGLAACNAKPTAVAKGPASEPQDAGYLAPPQPDTVGLAPGGVTLAGSAPASGRVRLATPAGQAAFATVDGRGRWAIVLPPASEPRIFGLSATAGGRQIQAEGYVLVTPVGQAALLRAGAAALRIDTAPQPGLRAIDFDGGGGLEITAQATPGATVILRLDRRQIAEGRADGDGRYVASLGASTPVGPGAHEVQAEGDGFSDKATVQMTAATPLAQGPLRSQLTPAGLRVDWMTPGGGVQSTLLIH